MKLLLDTHALLTEWPGFAEGENQTETSDLSPWCRQRTLSVAEGWVAVNE